VSTAAFGVESTGAGVVESGAATSGGGTTESGACVGRSASTRGLSHATSVPNVKSKGIVVPNFTWISARE
jgi:hypothetical protein